MKTRFLAALAVLPILFSPGTSALANDFPAKPITIIVPYSPGDGPDVIARLIGAKISGPLGQPVVIQNKAGAGGQIGLNMTAQAAPDGYTLGVGLIANLALAPNTYKSLPYDPLKDFAPVAELAVNYLGIVANPNAPFSTVADMIQWAKKNPGQLKVGTTGMGGFQHMSFALLAQMSNFTFENIPYKGTGQVVTDLTGGRIEVGAPAYTSVEPLIASGRLRLLGITSPARDPNLPQLPTIGESVKGYGSLGWYGVVAPAGTPRDIVLRLNHEINKALQSPEVRKTMATLGTAPVIESPEYFGEVIKSENAKFAKLVKDIGYEPQ